MFREIFFGRKLVLNVLFVLVELEMGFWGFFARNY